jgi:hypothetical protein
MDDFSVFPKDHRDAVSTVFEDGVAKGAAESTLETLLVVKRFVD